jgi:hypothetical protein
MMGDKLWRLGKTINYQVEGDQLASVASSAGRRYRKLFSAGFFARQPVMTPYL